MSIPVVEVRLSDPEPPVGTALHVGSAVPASGDRATFLRMDGGWHYVYGNGPWRPCSYELVRYWLPCRVTAGPLLAVRRAAGEWSEDDLQEAG